MASAWRRARRLALVGLVAVTVAALGWLAVALTDGDRRGEAQEVAPTANERPESGDDGTEDATGREPLSRSERSGGQADEDGDSASGSVGSGTASTPDRPAATPRGSAGSPSTTAPGSPPSTSPRGPAIPGTTAPPGPSSVGRPWHDVNVGACVNDLSPHPPPTITVVEEVGCAGPHRFEVMGVLNKPAQDYPGAEELTPGDRRVLLRPARVLLRLPPRALARRVGRLPHPAGVGPRHPPADMLPRPGPAQPGHDLTGRIAP